MQDTSDIGIQIPQVLLPSPGVDLHKWAVVACDQFTAEPQYWRELEALVGDTASTLRLIYPEVYLDAPDAAQRIASIGRTMNDYLQKGVLVAHDGPVYVERRVGGKTRHGLMLCLDLEHYDYRVGSSSLIRATEGTIVDRLPPRIKIRESAELELPHILVLIDDPAHTVIAPLRAAKVSFRRLYDFALMQGGCHLAGYAVVEAATLGVVQALRSLAEPEGFAARYGLPTGSPPLLFAMGDGNHSLATAKAIWERNKAQVGMDHPSRYALVEIENVHDDALEFEAIHRALFGLQKDLLAQLQQTLGDRFSYTPMQSAQALCAHVDAAHNVAQNARHVIGWMGGGQQFGVMEIAQPTLHLAVGTLQTFLDSFMADGGATSMDYVHGADVLERLSMQPGNAGFYLACMAKSDLFKTVILEGALPRKTFSLGQAREKRYYMEARRIG